MTVLSFSNWYAFDDYAEIISLFHQLTPKYNMVKILKESFEKVNSDATYFPELGDLSNPERQFFRVHISMQVLALVVELTEDLAATCHAYMTAISSKNKRVPENLRDFDKPDDFYNKASNKFVFAADAAGFDPISENYLALQAQITFRNISQFRDEFNKWYQGYKHGQRTIPMIAKLMDEQGKDKVTVWGTYMIPKDFTEIGNKIFFEHTFLHSVEKFNDYVQMADLVYRFWVETRNRQYQKVFGKPPDS